MTPHLARRLVLLTLVALAACSEQKAAPGPATGNDAPVTEPPPSPPPAPEPEPTASAPQPTPTAPPGAQCSGPPPAAGFECVRNCGPPVARAGDPDPGWSWLSPGQAKNRKQFGCPICLPDDARIATPGGEVEISRLVPGALVWSATEDGVRVARRVEHVLSVDAPPNHRISVIELADGRRLRASPGHPDAAGHPIGNLALGDALDGARVQRLTLVPYARRTFDLVLEGGAMTYYADGILVRSSIAPR